MSRKRIETLQISILPNLLRDTNMASWLLLSKNSPCREIFLKLLLCEINFIWTVKKGIFCDPKRKTLCLKGENSPFREIVFPPKFLIYKIRFNTV